MDISFLTNRKFRRMLANILSMLVILAMTFPATGRVYAEETSPKVGLVTYLGGVTDNSFNSMAYQGLLQAETDLGIVKSLYVPADDTQFDAMLEQCVDEGNGLCIAVGFNYGISLANAARANPGTNWAIVDSSYPDCWEGAIEGVDCGSFTEIPNVRGLKFNEKQAGYLAGVLAGEMTASNAIGAVGGMEIPSVVAFVDGYRNGAQCNNSDVNVLTAYTGTFSDPNLGAATAQDLIGQGADVIFGAAGETGNGAILYSAQNGQWAIGVDADQYLTLFEGGATPGSDRLLSSAMKRVDSAVYQTIADYVGGNFSSGTVVYDLAMNGVGLAPFHDADGSISQEIKDNLETVKQGIIDGTVNIDDSCTPPPPNPFIAVSLTQHWFWANNFSPETLVTFYVYENQGDETPILEFSRNTDAYGNVNVEGWEHLWTPQPGNYMVATDGVITKDLVLEYVTLDDFDYENNRISGTASLGRQVDVGVGNADGEQWLTVYADQPTNDENIGAWTADFNTLGFDITEDMWAGGHVNDEDGDVTVAHNSGPPEPPAWFTVFSEWDAIEGWNFPLGAVVHLTIDDPTTESAPDYEQDETVTFTPWGSWELWVWFDFAGQYDVKAGDVVTLTYKETAPTHTVRNLAVTKVDPEADIVKGIADAGAEVYVWPYAMDEEQLAIANPKGRWNVDFTGIYDLMPRDGGRARIWDETGNATEIDWNILQPRFTVYPDAQWFDGLDWPDGAPVTIMVKDKPECTLTRESEGGFFNGGFPEGCFVTAGDHVIFTNGTLTRKHVVQNLAIMGIDKDANTAWGTADTGAVIHTWVWDHDDLGIDITAVDGMWFADFGAVGLDLEVGMGIQAEIRDENGNTTSVDLNVPDPRMVASITEDWFYTADFNPGAALDLSIYASPGGDQIWSSQELHADVNGFAWIDAEGRWDLQPGNYLIVSDGNTTKELIIEGFTFDTFNLANGQLSGIAPEPNGRRVWVGIGWQDDGWSMDINTDESGAWLADFGTPVPSDYQWVAAQIFDADGDATELRPEQVVDLWVAAYTYDYGTWSDGGHSYHFEADWNGGSETTKEILFNVSGEAQTYDGYVLMRPGAVRAGAGCEAIDEINLNQSTRFLAGYVTDYAMTYEDAQAYFDSLSASVVWDDGQSAELVRHEIIRFREDNWFDYVCTFTAHVILDASQPDWVNSGIPVSAGQSFTIEAFGLMNPCSDTYPNGAEICIFYTPVGAEWGVPYENEFGIFPGPGLPFMALLGRVGDGEPFYIGEGGTFTAAQDGTLWFTPNDNLRTDNQGAYRVFVWPEP